MNRSIMSRSRLAVILAGAAAGIFAGSTLAQTSAPAQPAAKPVTVSPSASKPVAAQPAAKPEVKAIPKIGDAVTEFTLKDTDGKEHKLADLKGKIVVLEWFNPDCPVSAMCHTTSSVMTDTATEFKDKGVVWLAINSSGPGKEGNGVDRNAKARTDWKIAYPVLLDESGTVGRSFGAKTTPHMFIIDADGKLAYKGDIWDQADHNTNYVKQALTQLLAKETVTTTETRPNGCGVKYASEPKKSN